MRFIAVFDRSPSIGVALSCKLLSLQYHNNAYHDCDLNGMDLVLKTCFDSIKDAAITCWHQISDDYLQPELQPVVRHVESRVQIREKSMREFWFDNEPEIYGTILQSRDLSSRMLARFPAAISERGTWELINSFIVCRLYFALFVCFFLMFFTACQTAKPMKNCVRVRFELWFVEERVGTQSEWTEDKKSNADVAPATCTTHVNDYAPV